MGLFGGSSRSTTSNEETNFTNVDNRIIESGANVGGNVSLQVGDGGGDISISSTDYGAIDTAREIANDALNTVRSSVNKSTDNVAQLISSASKIAESDTTETIKYLIIGLTIVGGLFAFRKLKIFK